MKTQSQSRNQNLHHANLAAPRLWKFPLLLLQQNGSNDWVSPSVVCTLASCTITTGTFSLADPGPAIGGAAVLKIFGGHLQRVLAPNQDETAELMRSSHSLLPTAGPLIKMRRRVLTSFSSQQHQGYIVSMHSLDSFSQRKPSCPCSFCKSPHSFVFASLTTSESSDMLQGV